MKIGGILENHNLTLYRIFLMDDTPGAAGSILKFFAQRSINLEYITESTTNDGYGVLAICINNEFVEQVDNFIAENQAALESFKITKIANVSTLGIYGPHFREKHSIAARFCTLLGAAGVNILGMSSSISSVCCVIESDLLEQGKAAILKRFELP
jgi:aspartokinase